MVPLGTFYVSIPFQILRQERASGMTTVLKMETRIWPRDLPRAKSTAKGEQNRGIFRATELTAAAQTTFPSFPCSLMWPCD